MTVMPVKEKLHIAHIYGGVNRMHGATKWLLLFASHLRRKGHQSSIFCTNFSIPLPFWFEGEVVPLLKRFRIGKEISGLRKIAYTAFQLLAGGLVPLKIKSADIVVYHAEMSLWAALLAKLRFRGAQHVYYCYQPPRELYDLVEGTKKQFGVWYHLLLPLLEVYKKIDKHLVGSMDRVLVWSPEYEEYARAIYGDINISQLPASVDFGLMESVADLDKKVASLMDRHGLKGSKVLLTVSALNWKKNLDVFIRLVARLREAGDSIHGIIVGEGPERTKLDDLSQRLGVQDFVHIVGFVSQEELPVYYHLADIVYFLEHNAAWTMSTIEAGAARKPVIVASGGSAETLVIDGETGYILDDIQVIDDVANRTRAILNSRELANELGTANHAHSRKFSVDASVDQFLSLQGPIQVATRLTSL